METNLRQANSKAEVEGVVSEIALEKKIRNKNGQDEEYISGYVTIKTSDVNFVKIGVMCSKYTDKGTEAKPYAGIVTVMNEYKSIAKYGEDEADRVRVNGNINPYTNDQGVTNVTYKSNFFNRVKGECIPKAEFKIEGFVKSIVPEIGTDGEETGRAKINIWVPTYNGIEPVELIVEEDGADDAMSYFEPGETYEFWGDINAVQKREEKILSGGFGKERKETKITFKNELLCTGGSDPYDEDSVNEPYDADAIKLAIQQREDLLKERRENGGNKTQKKSQPSGKASGRSLSF